MTKIEVGQLWMNRSGDTIKIVHIKNLLAEGFYPVVAVDVKSNGVWTYSLSGKWNIGKDHYLDLIELISPG